MKEEMSKMVSRTELFTKEYQLNLEELNNIKKNKDFISMNKTIEVMKQNKGMQEVLSYIKKNMLSKGDKNKFNILIKEHFVKLN